MQIKYRIGVMPGPWPGGSDGAEFLWRLVDLCETTEIDSLWFSERLSSPLPVPEPMTTLAAVAARTRRLKFGPSVFITPFRNPVTAAREIAMIDYLSGGRMLPAFGIGVEQEREFHAAGVPFKERGRRTDEALAIMRRCWSESEVTYEGEFWRLDKITVLPRPVQQPLPAWIGGNSDAAMKRAGRLGDGWIPSFIPPDRFAAGVARTQAFAADAGREVPSDHFGTLVNFCFAPDRASAQKIAEPFVPRNRVDDATHRVRAHGAAARAPRAICRRRRLEVHRAADVPARDDARPAAPAGRGGRAGVPSALLNGTAVVRAWSPSRSSRPSRAGRAPLARS
jgi:probable F420-dependent oxidoreductase